ncbi:MAG: hypothetical protein GY679_00085 [Mycoplasma sp.]|nr:hypothetical protein [Mycoplasma sp.]
MSTGLDLYIEKAISIFTDQLWSGYNNAFLGRSYRVKKGGNIRPEIYNETTQNKKYKEVFFTNKYDSIVHFDIEPFNPLTGDMQKTSSVNIFFAVNIGKIYGNDSRAAEQCQYDIMSAIINTSFKATGFVDQLPAYTDIYDLTPSQENQYNMQPYYVIRIETEIMAGLGDCLPKPRPVQYALTLSHEGEGLTFIDGVQSVDGIYSKQADSTIQFAASPLEGSEFVSWVIDETYEYPTPSILMDGAKSAIATFKVSILEYTLTGIISNGYGDITPNNGLYGGELEISCVPDSRFTFTEWDINGNTETDNPYLFTINEDTTATATLTPIAEHLQFPNNTLNLTEVLDLDKILSLWALNIKIYLKQINLVKRLRLI